MNIVKELRKKRNIQQKELAIEIGVSCPTVSEWESQKKDPSGERLEKLARYFGVDELVILGKALSDQERLKTIEAQTIGEEIDKLPKEDRQKALSMIKIMFSDRFKG